MTFPFIFNRVEHFWGVYNTLKGHIGNIYDFLPEFELPISIKVSNCVTNEITFTCESFGESWLEKHNFYFEDIKIYTKSGKLIWEELWDIYEQDEYKIFKLLNSYKNTKGIVIGAHDGKYGEWITLLENEDNEILLVEPSDEQFYKLKTNFGKRKNVRLLNSLITCEGGEVEFYEGPSGYFNSTNKTHLQNIYNNEEIKVVKRNSVSLVHLLQNYFVNELDWIHMDTESYDAKLILSLKNNQHLLPKIILFEHRHLDLNEKQELERFLFTEGYKTKTFSDNIIAFK